MRALTIFLDDGGVLNDNARRAPEWQRLVGEFFAPRLGGLPERWAAANGAMFAGYWEKAMMEQARLGLVDAYEGWSRGYQTGWLRIMAEEVGVSIPAAEDAVFALAVEAANYITANCRSAFSDAAPAVEALSGAGFELNTASGTASNELDCYLTGMGIRARFTHLFGPDLVDAFKASHLYYERAFRQAGLAPGACLVADDSPEALGWAAAAGALTVLIDRDGRHFHFEGARLQSLEMLPELVEYLDHRARR